MAQAVERGSESFYQGSDFKLSQHTIGPLPWTSAGPPVLMTAGNRGEFIPAQIDRFARLGDGIITTYLTDDDCRTLRAAQASKRWQRRGRSLPDFPICVYTTVRIDNEVAEAEADTQKFLHEYYGGGVNYRGLMGLGPAPKVVETLKRYEAAGVTDLCVRFAGADQIRQLEQFIRGVAPAFAAT